MDEPQPGGGATTGPVTAIVVPCYNEAERFDSDAFEGFLRRVRDVSFVLVNDGSSDGTGDVLDALAARWPGRVEALHLHPNAGKAEAVRRGILAAMAVTGARYVGFWDADLATPLEAVPVFVAVLERRPDLDMVLGARVQLLGRTIERKATRHYLGRVFATFASVTLALPVYDTQCGAKLFRVGDDMRALFEEPFGSRWVFDVELIARYMHQRGARDGSGIFELPLDSWRDVGESKVKPVDFVRAIGEMMRIGRRYRLPARYRKLFDLVTAPFVRYSGAGAIGTAFHYVLLTACVELFGLAPAVGAVVGASGGALVNYWFNYHFTFVSDRNHTETLPRFLTVAAVGVGINGLLVDLTTRHTDLHYLVGQLVATITVLLVGFVLNRAWTFGARH